MWISQIVRDTRLTAADAWALADDRSTWRALWPTAGYAQQWVSEWVLLLILITVYTTCSQKNSIVQWISGTEDTNTHGI